MIFKNTYSTFAIPGTAKWRAEQEAKREVLEQNEVGLLDRWFNADVRNAVSDAKGEAADAFKTEKKDERITRRQEKTDAEIPTIGKTGTTPETGSNSGIVAVIAIVIVVAVVLVFVFK